MVLFSICQQIFKYTIQLQLLKMWMETIPETNQQYQLCLKQYIQSQFSWQISKSLDILQKKLNSIFQSQTDLSFLLTNFSKIYLINQLEITFLIYQFHRFDPKTYQTFIKSYSSQIQYTYYKSSKLYIYLEFLLHLQFLMVKLSLNQNSQFFYTVSNSYFLNFKQLYLIWKTYTKSAISTFQTSSNLITLNQLHNNIINPNYPSSEIYNFEEDLNQKVDIQLKRQNKISIKKQYSQKKIFVKDQNLQQSSKVHTSSSIQIPQIKINKITNECIIDKYIVIKESQISESKNKKQISDNKNYQIEWNKMKIEQDIDDNYKSTRTSRCVDMFGQKKGEYNTCIKKISEIYFEAHKDIRTKMNEDRLNYLQFPILKIQQEEFKFLWLGKQRGRDILKHGQSIINVKQDIDLQKDNNKVQRMIEQNRNGFEYYYRMQSGKKQKKYRYEIRNNIFNNDDEYVIWQDEQEIQVKLEQVSESVERKKNIKKTKQVKNKPKFYSNKKVNKIKYQQQYNKNNQIKY